MDPYNKESLIVDSHNKESLVVDPYNKDFLIVDPYYGPEEGAAFFVFNHSDIEHVAVVKERETLFKNNAPKHCL